MCFSFIDVFAKVKMDVEKTGFVANIKKSQWYQSQEGAHLGFLIDLKNGIFTAPKSRTDKLQDLQLLVIWQDF